MKKNILFMMTLLLSTLWNIREHNLLIMLNFHSFEEDISAIVIAAKFQHCPIWQILSHIAIIVMECFHRWQLVHQYAEIFKGSLAYLVGKCAFTLKSQSLPYHYGRNAEYFHQAFTNLFCYMNVLFHISLVLIINILVELGESNPTWLSSARQTCHSCGLSSGHPRPTLPTIQCGG